MGLRDRLKFQKDMAMYYARGAMAESTGFSKRLTIEQQMSAMAESVRLSEALITLLLFKAFLPSMWYFQVFMGVAVIFRIYQMSRLLFRYRREDRERLKGIDSPDK